MLAEKSIFTQDSSLFDSYPPISQTNVLLCTCEDIPDSNTTYGLTNCSYDQTTSCLRRETDKIICETYEGQATLNPFRKKRSPTDKTQNEDNSGNASVYVLCHVYAIQILKISVTTAHLCHFHLAYNFQTNPLYYLLNRRC